MPACQLLQRPTLPVEDFATVEALARRVHQMRAARPIVLKRGTITTTGDTGRPGLIIRYADGGETLGYAVIGEPALAQGVQYDLLGGALAALCQDLAA
jgi:hypothetical protein